MAWNSIAMDPSVCHTTKPSADNIALVYVSEYQKTTDARDFSKSYETLYEATNETTCDSVGTMPISAQSQRKKGHLLS